MRYKYECEINDANTTMRDEYIDLVSRKEKGEKKYYVRKQGNVSPYKLGTSYEPISTVLAEKILYAESQSEAWQIYCDEYLQLIY